MQQFPNWFFNPVSLSVGLSAGLMSHFGFSIFYFCLSVFVSVVSSICQSLSLSYYPSICRTQSLCLHVSVIVFGCLRLCLAVTVAVSTKRLYKNVSPAVGLKRFRLKDLHSFFLVRTMFIRTLRLRLAKK